MVFAFVVGTVVSTQRDDGIPDAKYLLVEKCDQYGSRKGSYIVALDHVGAERDELVLVSEGSPNRNTPRTNDRPIDASILGIVDLVDEMGTVVYQKYK